MMKILTAVALLTGAALAHAQSTPARKELAQKLVQVQTASFENIARQIVERPVAQLMQQASTVLQTQVAPDKREAAARSIEADIRKYVDETVPVVRERAVKLAPSTYGVALEEKFSEDELKQLIAWFDSPLNKKLQQAGPEMLSSFGQKLVADAGPVIEPRLQSLQQKMRTTLGIPAPAAPGASGAAKAQSAPKPASK